MRCAAPRTLLSNNPALFLFLGVFAVGAIFFALGSAIIRAQTRPVPRTVDPDEAERVILSVSKGGLAAESFEVRLDYVERLAIVGQPWCVDELEAIRANESDARVRDAADAALTVIRSRSY